MTAKHLQFLATTSAALAALLLSTGCQTTSIKSTWKSPDFQGGPARKVALVAVAPKGLVRGGFENRFAHELAKTGQASLTTYETLPLQEIKADKKAAAARLQKEGADVILILRLVNTTTRVSEVKTQERWAAVLTGPGYDGWHDYYSMAFVDLSSSYSSTRQNVFLETSLFDLATGKRIWSCVTDTVVRDDVDRLDLADAFVARVVQTLRKDGLVR